MSFDIGWCSSWNIAKCLAGQDKYNKNSNTKTLKNGIPLNFRFGHLVSAFKSIWLDYFHIIVVQWTIAILHKYKCNSVQWFSIHNAPIKHRTFGVAFQICSGHWTQHFIQHMKHESWMFCNGWAKLLKNKKNKHT